ncbi:hypothetical protein HJC99_01325 [Candidatus Saccharibacteria bacterium]|nr:hypothetical protein [Candidatus Saccharibacteria bacterium]
MNDDQTPISESVDQASADLQIVPPVETDELVGAAPGDVPQPNAPSFQWQASEYVQHHKNGGWYFGVVATVVVLSGLAYLLKSRFSIALFVVMGAAVIVYAKRPPRMLTYELSDGGLTIDSKHYPFQAFRSFSVIRDIAWHSIELEPTQRFMPRMSVLFDDNDFDAIVKHLLERLPRVDREPDFVERATRYLRF